MTSYDKDGIMIEKNIELDDERYTVSVTPFFQDEDRVQSPMMFSAHLVVGVLQDRYDAMLARQLTLQAAIMAVECVVSILALVFTYWPLKKFLDNLERAFNVPSYSMEMKRKMDDRAAAMLDETTRPSAHREQTKPDTAL